MVFMMSSARLVFRITISDGAASNLEKGLLTSEARVNQRFHCRITDKRAQPRGEAEEGWGRR